MIIDFAQDIPIPRCRYGSAADMSRKVARFGPCVPPCVSGKKTAGKIPVRLNLLPLKSVCGRAAPTGYISPQKTGYEKRNDVQNTHLRRTPHGKPESDRHAGRLGTESAQPGRDDLHRPGATGTASRSWSSRSTRPPSCSKRPRIWAANT